MVLPCLPGSTAVPGFLPSQPVNAMVSSIKAKQITKNASRKTGAGRRDFRTLITNLHYKAGLCVHPGLQRPAIISSFHTRILQYSQRAPKIIRVSKGAKFFLSGVSRWACMQEGSPNPESRIDYKRCILNSISFAQGFVLGFVGLTSMRERTELTGGSLSIESTLGEGTRLVEPPGQLKLTINFKKAESPTSPQHQISIRICSVNSRITLLLS